MIGIHPVHRKLAEFAQMNLQKDGSIVLDVHDRVVLLRLLKQNLELVQELDGLKQLAHQLHLIGEMEWHQEVRSRIEEIETKMI
ncbi:hypothetical protein SAMN02799630_02833 [Paenibacillus sp. UNCCL117]|uniref:DUF7667 family protein n=1 Tax=unclassified Paenibacillus TaxID=185978 RepID=UPI00088C4E38|nr:MULTISPECIES: hypothetical protein [unclassified Paenibacillus]SDD28689.1 hypothetical protein SAMN04488602_107158 [Paenibacillus sp. cl123]SFW40879.1 hypothetical protein SAMN02799630_02833 [Paenibacillus sp. UNCCL117]